MGTIETVTHGYTAHMDDEFAPPAASGTTLSVSELNRQARMLLERGLGKVGVEGELSNLARPASGHLYFSLKDQNAQVRCAYFRQRQRGPTIQLKNGDQMRVYGRISLYEARGDYQLIVEDMEAAGEGELRRQFEALKKKLAAEGLFDEAAKRPLPALPHCIGIITSPSGAAVRDILTVLRRRFPSIPVVIYPAAVQGDAAVGTLMSALETAGRRAECDVLVLARGGGSLEDLWAFNDEGLARAIRASPVPVVSGVGHEVDFTIADFVADLRAPTPSGAAELVVPDQAVWQRSLGALAVRLAALVRRQLEARHQRVDWLAQRLSRGSPAATVSRQSDRLAALRMRLRLAVRHDLTDRRRRLERARDALRHQSPAIRVERAHHRHGALNDRLRRAALVRLEKAAQRLRLAGRALHSVSPLATLSRGYAIVSDARTGHVIRDVAGITIGDRVQARLSRGILNATVTDTVEPVRDDDDA